jgi:hypothetical protein
VWHGFLGTVLQGEAGCGEVRLGMDIKEKKMNVASVIVGDNLKEQIGRFAWEGLPYIIEQDNWVDFNEQFTVNIWWNDEEQTYRATAYMKMGGRPYIEKGIDLF